MWTARLLVLASLFAPAALGKFRTCRCGCVGEIVLLLVSFSPVPPSLFLSSFPARSVRLASVSRLKWLSETRYPAVAMQRVCSTRSIAKTVVSNAQTPRSVFPLN